MILGVGVGYFGYNVQIERGQGGEQLQVDRIVGGGRGFGAQSMALNLQICWNNLSSSPNEKRKVTAKRLPSKKEGKDTGKKRSKTSVTTDMPKRPATAFILFMSRFKEELKKQNPNIKTALVTLSKSAGTKWKSMSEEDREKHDVCSGSDSLVLQSTELNLLDVMEDNTINFSIIPTPNII